MDVRLSFSIPIVIAIVIGELFSVLFYSNVFPWGHQAGDRYLIPAILGDVGLAFLVQWLMRNYWAVRKWEDAAWMGVGLALAYACLEAPHSVWNHSSFIRFFFHTLHKCGIVFVMALALWNFKNY